MKITPGQIRVNDGRIVARGRRCALYEIDCETKRPELMTYGATDSFPSIYLCANEETLRWDRRYKRPTEIQFTDYGGWRIHSVNVARYSVYVALVKPRLK